MTVSAFYFGFFGLFVEGRGGGVITVFFSAPMLTQFDLAGYVRVCVSIVGRSISGRSEGC